MDKMIVPNPQYYYKKSDRKNDPSYGDLHEALYFINLKFQTGEVHSILEIGCGLAGIVKFLPAELEYAGIDIMPYAIEKSKLNHSRYNFIIAQADKLPFADQSFNLIFSHQVLEMLFEPQRSLQEMMRVVMPGGFVVIIAPNLEIPWAKINAVRHYSRAKKVKLSMLRWGDLVARAFGKLNFRVLDENYTQATGKFEKGDDDMRYITSAHEVASFFKRNGFQELRSKTFKLSDNSFKIRIKAIMAKLPIFRYYNGGMFFIFRKPK